VTTDEAERRLRRPDARARAGGERRAVSVWWLVVAAGCVATALWVLVPAEPTPVGVTVHPLALAALFCVAEIAVIQLWVRGEAHSKSLSEVPLALGLLIVPRTDLLFAALVGAGVVLIVMRRQHGAKLAFNVAQYALQVTVALTVFAVVVDRGGDDNVRAWIGAIGAALVAELVSSALVTMALYLHVGEVDLHAILHSDLISIPGVIASSSVGVLAALLFTVEPGALVLLTIVVGATVGAYRGYGTLLRRHHHLQLLQGYSRDIGEAVASDDVIASALRGAAGLLGAQRAYLVLVVPDRPGHVLRCRFALGEVRTGIEPIDPADPVAAVLGTEEAVHLRRSSVTPARRTALAHLGIGELLVAPLRADGVVVGALAVANDPSSVDAFDRNDLALFVTLCDQTALTLQNGRLLSALRAEIEEREHRALHDDVTGLGNRAALLEALDQRCRDDEAPVAVAVIGLDRFGEINEALGYERGDDVLALLAHRMQLRLRQSDRLARLSGGEFALVFDDIAHPDAARAAVHSVVTAIGEPIAVGGIEITLGAHAGIALGPEHARDASALLRRADAAFRVARDARRAVEVYDEQRDHDAGGRLVLATQLRHAIERSELTVAYQPKCDLADGHITGVEALVRWEHPERGFIPPDEFVLLAEQTGSIHALTEFVFRRALADRKTWADHGLELALSVNVSARDLEHDWLRNEVPGLLAANACPPGSLTLEITETQLMADVARAAEAIQPLHDLGVRVSIDDYGTGYSSLAVLRALPIDEIKIDKSFVLDMRADDNDAVVVRSTVQLGQALGLEVVAEGVETTVSWHLLQDWGCDRAQGYLIARPIPPDRIPAIIEAWVPPEAEVRPRLGLVS
jgi:diguanylate cyclase (GGDEF)-like protein